MQYYESSSTLLAMTCTAPRNIHMVCLLCRKNKLITQDGGKQGPTSLPQRAELRRRAVLNGGR